MNLGSRFHGFPISHAALYLWAMKESILDRVIIRFSVGLLVGGSLLAACGGEGKEKREIIISTASDKTISIDPITKFPPEIDGCASYYAASKKDFEEKKYLYVDNRGDLAYVKINGVLTKFTRNSPDTSGKRTSKQVWENKDYELTIILKNLKQIDEVTEQEGVMILKPKKGAPVVKKLIGECGC